MVNTPDAGTSDFRFDLRPAMTADGVGTVRRLLRDRLVAGGIDPDTPCLLLSELLTNALLHGRGATVLLELRAGRLLIAVADGSPGRVEIKPASATRTTGRGMVLIEALADDWGVTPISPHGKAVWASVAAVGPALPVRPGAGPADLLGRANLLGRARPRRTDPPDIASAANPTGPTRPTRPTNPTHLTKEGGTTCSATVWSPGTPSSCWPS
ncbi:ATP-binding protein [Kitasatospora sp. NPDC057015]|uniref:ATP-binding protein n=1 Tax=Kitasatospora sp. NPDC057015 TaxID=3346001 RepID=UPI003634B9F6